MIWLVLALVGGYILFLQFKHSSLLDIVVFFIFLTTTIAIGFYGWSLYWMLLIGVAHAAYNLIKRQPYIKHLERRIPLQAFFQSFKATQDLSLVFESGFCDVMKEKETKTSRSLTKTLYVAVTQVTLIETLSFSLTALVIYFVGYVFGGN